MKTFMLLVAIIGLAMFAPVSAFALDHHGPVVVHRHHPPHWRPWHHRPNHRPDVRVPVRPRAHAPDASTYKYPLWHGPGEMK